MTSTTVPRAAEDRELFERLRALDEEAQETLARRYGPRLLAVARHFLRVEEDCADAVQDAFLSAFRSLDRFGGNSSLGTWLHRILVNVCLMKLRARSHSRQVPLDDLLPTFDEGGYQCRRREPQESALARLTLAETRAQVRSCIDQLPEPYREVLLLRDIEESDTEQTAARLGITSGAVKVRLHRARQALRMLLEARVSGS